MSSEQNFSPEKIEISPSILAADFSRLGEEISAVEEAGADRLHLDVMDGAFVPNITFGMPVIKAISGLTELPLEVHLMIERPERYLSKFAEVGASTIVVHCEAVTHLERALAEIRDLGCKAGVALNPGTPPEMIRYVLHRVDQILVMTVNPGFSGQRFIPEVLPKIRQIRSWVDEIRKGIDIAVDGGINMQTAPAAVAAGANVLVAASAIFNGEDRNYRKRISSLRLSREEGQ